MFRLGDTHASAYDTAHQRFVLTKAREGFSHTPYKNAYIIFPAICLHFVCLILPLINSFSSSIYIIRHDSGMSEYNLLVLSISFSLAYNVYCMKHKC